MNLFRRWSPAPRPVVHQHNIAERGQVNATVTGDITVFGKPGPAETVPDRVRVLMLAAGPAGAARLAVDEEVRQITERLRLSRDRDAFDLITCWAVRPADLLRHLNQHRPHIVQFSGHGGRTGEILLAGDRQGGRPVPAEALAEVFGAAGDELRVVLLNACHSAAAVTAIGRYVDYVIGMRAPIPDPAAALFAAEFYSALGFGRRIPQAFRQAVTGLSLEYPAAARIPHLAARPQAVPVLTKGPQ